MEGVVSRVATPELTAHRRSLGALTGIRFFAAFYVVIFHTRVAEVLLEHGHHAASYFFASGYLAVPLFFLLSGFILAYTYKGQVEQPGDFRRFWEARFARIWPVYAVSLLLSSVPSFTFPKPGVAVAALCMVQAWNPFDVGMAGAWNLVCWTLSVEALFYLCFPWLQNWIERRSLRIQLLFIGLSLIVCVALNSASRSLGYTAQGVFVWIPLPLLHLSEFFTGVGMGNYFLQRSVLAGGRPGATMLKGAGTWTYVSALATIALLCRPSGRWTSLVVIAFSALIFGLAAERTLLSRFLSTKTMLLGGGISYSIYLMQMPLKFWVASIAKHLHVESEMIRMVVTAVLLILFSLLLFKLVEDPARRLLRSLFAEMEQRRQTAAERRKVTPC
jgi:peptidoglycan/LPS O-acetylase OafA/YrhL